MYKELIDTLLIKIPEQTRPTKSVFYAHDYYMSMVHLDMEQQMSHNALYIVRFIKGFLLSKCDFGYHFNENAILLLIKYGIIHVDGISPDYIRVDKYNAEPFGELWDKVYDILEFILDETDNLYLTYHDVTALTCLANKMLGTETNEEELQRIRNAILDIQFNVNDSVVEAYESVSDIEVPIETFDSVSEPAFDYYFGDDQE